MEGGIMSLLPTALRLAALLTLTLAASNPASAAETVWIEGESLASLPPGFKAAGWGNKHYLSGETWLFANVDGKDAEAIPAEGITLAYPFETKAASDFEVWARLGYEFVRSPFKWRIDAGGWGENGPADLTTDLMELAEWTEVAWVKLGTTKLEAGKHTLTLNFPRRDRPNQKQPERILAGLDCFCLSAGPFRPNGRFKPDEEWRQDIDRKAAANTFAVKAGQLPRTLLPLKGAWQIARWDEQEIQGRDAPVKELPNDYADFHWKG